MVSSLRFLSRATKLVDERNELPLLYPSTPCMSRTSKSNSPNLKSQVRIFDNVDPFFPPASLLIVGLQLSLMKVFWAQLFVVILSWFFTRRFSATPALQRATPYLPAISQYAQLWRRLDAIRVSLSIIGRPMISQRFRARVASSQIGR